MSATAATTATENREQHTLTSALTQAGIEHHVPGDATFKDASSIYNLRLAPIPIAVLQPADASQVAAAVQTAAQHGVPVTCRGGGHSYAAFSTGGTDGKLVVDLSKLKSFSYDEKTHRATAGAGTRLGELALAIHARGRAMPHGTCPTVGLSGHATHGGYGFYSRMWGLALDRIVGLEVVVADGSIKQASLNENSDLFWALRGAAPSFGIVTSFTLTTEPIPTQNIKLHIIWDVPVSDAIDAFMRFQDNLKQAPIELGYAFRLGNGKTDSTLKVEFVGCFCGTVEGLQKFLGPQIDALPKPSSHIMEPIAYLPMLEWLSESPLGLRANEGPKMTDTFYAKSLTVHEDHPMTSAQAKALVEYLGATKTNLDWFAMADNWGGLINSVPSDATAFSGRNNLFGWQFYARTADLLPPFPKSGITFVQGMYDALVKSRPDWHHGGYSCYVDPELSAKDAHRLYYGDAYPRLQAIKKDVDPNNVFSYPHSVGTV